MTRVAAGLATASTTAAAVADAAAQASVGLEGRSADLAFLFLTPDHLATAAEAAAAVRETLGPRHLLGCVAQGVIGRETRARERPGRGALGGLTSGRAAPSLPCRPDG